MRKDGAVIEAMRPGRRPAGGGPAVGWARTVWAQVRLNHTVMLRQRGLAVTILVMPLFFVVLYTVTVRGNGLKIGIPPRPYVGVGTLAMGFATAFMSVTSAVVGRREERVYKRLRGTPLPVGSIFAGDILHAVLVALVQEVVAGGYLIVALHAPVPHDIVLVLVGSAVGAAVFCALALGVSGLLPSVEVAQLAAVPVLLVGALGSGMMVPLSVFPDWARRVGEVLPLTPAVRMIRTGWFGRDLSVAPVKGVTPPRVGFLEGFQVSAVSLGVALLWIALGLWLTRRFFRWDPRRA